MIERLKLKLFHSETDRNTDLSLTLMILLKTDIYFGVNKLTLNPLSYIFNI